MTEVATTEYISAGGNRHTAASDWSLESGILAYGSDQNIALWQPLDEDARGVFALLRGHKTKVTAVRFTQSSDDDGDDVLLSGSADGGIRVWEGPTGEVFECVASLKAHEGAVSCITALYGSGVFATGGADSTIKLWRLDGGELQCLSTMATKPRFIPLALAVEHFEDDLDNNNALLVAGGTRNDIQLYGIEGLNSIPTLTHCGSLSGHEGWIRSLSVKRLPTGGCLIASTSADKYIRIWKLSSEQPANGSIRDTTEMSAYQSTLNAKVQKVFTSTASYNVTFEALLLGHEDWVYSAAWNPLPDSQQLLSASADGTLTLWEPDSSSGIWVSVTRLGEISGQKGATTATGSSGGFWSALWSPSGNAVTCLGRTGSWRLWLFNEGQQYWVQRTAATGHVSSVNGISWAPNGAYLLSTSSDQTTRLHVEWRRDTKRTWHEFARPQIHGYDLNCISATSNTQFASGADEKLLRVFDEPKPTSRLLQRLCRIDDSDQGSLPETAAIPVLGLSNKAMDQTNGDDEETNGASTEQAPFFGDESSVEQLQEPPTEDLLARHTLWPEREKLYGHGYEISTSASNGDLLATACKASSLDHAVIRLYDTTTWTEIRPPLTAHNLTVTRLAWSHPAHSMLLSVGRDRQWAVSKQVDGKWQIVHSQEKAHTRMILDAVWSPDEKHCFFATAGRDKTVKLWASSAPAHAAEFKLVRTLTQKAAVTAVALCTTGVQGIYCMAVGEDDGTVSIHSIQAENGFSITDSALIPESQGPSKTITHLAWRPQNERYASDDQNSTSTPLAIASADSSLRILRVNTGQFASMRT